MTKITVGDLLGLQPKKANFVIEYVKDFTPRRAAEASGFRAEAGYNMLNEPEISAAIERILTKRLENNMIDTDWLLFEMVDNHMIARQQGNINASNTALKLVGQHKRVDAFAAEKIKVTTDADVMDRLTAGRNRMAEKDDDEGELSFL